MLALCGSARSTRTICSQTTLAIMSFGGVRCSLGAINIAVVAVLTSHTVSSAYTGQSTSNFEGEMAYVVHADA